MQFTTTLLETCNQHLGQHPQAHELQDTQGDGRPQVKTCREADSDCSSSKTDDSSLLHRESSSKLSLSDAKLEDNSNTCINTGCTTSPDARTRHTSLDLEATCTGTDVTSDPSSSSHNSGASSSKEATESQELYVTCPELLRALDVLSVLLPAARVWFDWLAHQKELWSQCFSSVHATVL